MKRTAAKSEQENEMGGPTIKDLLERNHEQEKRIEHLEARLEQEGARLERALHEATVDRDNFREIWLQVREELNAARATLHQRDALVAWNSYNWMVATQRIRALLAGKPDPHPEQATR